MTRIMRHLSLLVGSVFFLNNHAFAATPQLSSVHLTVVAQSSAESGAHAIVPGVSTNCSGWLYIGFGDKEMFATALSSVMQGKAVNLIYDDTATSVYIAGQGVWVGCKIISLWVS
jgi:hypothetical protein